MISRYAIEMNLNWAEQHPELFVEAVRDFQNNYGLSHEWEITVDLSLRSYMKLTARRKV